MCSLIYEDENVFLKCEFLIEMLGAKSLHASDLYELMVTLLSAEHPLLHLL